MEAGASKEDINPAQTVMKHADSPVGKGRRTRIKDAAACYISYADPGAKRVVIISLIVEIINLIVCSNN